MTDEKYGRLQAVGLVTVTFEPNDKEAFRRRLEWCVRHDTHAEMRQSKFLPSHFLIGNSGRDAIRRTSSFRVADSRSDSRAPETSQTKIGDAETRKLLRLNECQERDSNPHSLTGKGF